MSPNVRHKAPKIDGNLVKCRLLQGCAYSGWPREIWLGPENQPGVLCAKPRQVSPTARLCVSRMTPQNLVGPRKSTWSVCYSPRKWYEMTVFRKACAPASPGPKYRPEWCPTSRSLRAHPCYMKFVEIERNFPDLKTGSSRVQRGTKCPQKVPRRAP